MLEVLPWVGAVLIAGFLILWAMILGHVVFNCLLGWWEKELK